MRWMKLEPIIQSEVNQKEKHQYSILTHMYGIQEDGSNNPVCETPKETQMYITVFWTLGVDDGQGGLAYCGSGDCKVLDMTERWN